MSHSNYYVFAPSPLRTTDFLRRLLLLLEEFHITLDDADPAVLRRRLSGLRAGGKGFEVYATWKDVRKPRGLLGEVSFLFRRRENDRLGPSGIEFGIADSDTYRINRSEHHFNQYVRFVIACCAGLQCSQHFCTGDDSSSMRAATTKLLLKELTFACQQGAVVVTGQLFEEANLASLLSPHARVWTIPSRDGELRLACEQANPLNAESSWVEIGS